MPSQSSSPSPDGLEVQDRVMPIAVIGLAGRYPGDAANPEKLWDLISNARSAMTEVPADRFNIDSFYHPNNERSGTINLRGGHFMKRDVDAFDAPFFSITPNEAKALDPQQRMALECTYEALENAGLRIEELAGSDVSCYVGSFSKDYSELMAADQEDLPLYFGVGTGTAILSNRVSWFFDFRGPSISIDTACSSALVALHLGCQSLRTGESKMAVVGGVNSMTVPGVMTAMTALGFLSPDSICHSFDEKANGYARGEGASFVVLKPLDQAIKDGDMIRGVIRNTACNQDGNTPGITVPSADSQESMIRRCYTDAGLPLSDTQFAEAHGTGTQQGDPKEAQALSNCFGRARAPGDPLLIGSIKSNIGHLEGASGLAQLTKAVFALEKAEIPPNIWYDKPNPRIPMDEWNLQVVTKLTPWPHDGPRRISINSFGYGGTNAHCIIDDAYHYLAARGMTANHNTVVPAEASTPSTDSGLGMASTPLTPGPVSLSNAVNQLNYFDTDYVRPPKLFVISSNEASGSQRAAKSYAEYLKVKTEESSVNEDALLSKLAYTLSSKRSILPWRTFAVASSVKELCSTFEKGLTSPVRSTKQPKIGFVFTGQGAQWHAMGRKLNHYPIYRHSLESASSFMLSLGASWSLLEEMGKSAEDSRVGEPHLSQPICTALQVALIDLLASWNIKPSAVIGHSSGEIAAAYAKGALVKEDAWTIAYHRGRLSQNVASLNLGSKGCMMAVGLAATDCQRYLEAVVQGRAVVACKNSPSSTTLSGDLSAINELETSLQGDGIFARKLKVDVAYHSPHMNAIADHYLAAINSIVPQSEHDTGVRMFSSVTGGEIANHELNAEYWIRNMVSYVDFVGAMQSLNKHTLHGTRRTKKPYCDVLLEIGPHGALQGPIKEICREQYKKDTQHPVYSLLSRGQDASLTALAAVGQLFQHGHSADLASVNDNVEQGPFLVDMSPYPWNHQNKYWYESQVSKNYRFRKHPRTDLLGSRIPQANSIEPLWRNMLRLNEIPWIEHHKVQGTILYPAAGMMVMAIEAVAQIADTTRAVLGYELRDIIIGKAIVISPDDNGTETMLSLRPWRLGSQTLSSSWDEFRVFSRQGDTWELNCTGLVRVKYAKSDSLAFVDEDATIRASYVEKYHKVSTACTRTVTAEAHYEHLSTIGLNFSGPFKGIHGVRKGDFKSNCDLLIPDTKSMMPHDFEYNHVIHPSTLDLVIQIGLAGSTKVDEELFVALIPTSCECLFVSAEIPSLAGTALHGVATIDNDGSDNAQGSFVLLDDTLTIPLVVLDGVKSTAVRHGEIGFAQAAMIRKPAAYFHWQEDLSKLDSDKLALLCRGVAKCSKAIGATTIVELEHAAFIYMKRVMAGLAIGEVNNFAQHFKTFHSFMEKTMVDSVQRSIPHQGQALWLLTKPEEEEELLERVGRSSADGKLLCKAGDNMLSFMRGETSAIETLMQDNCLHDYYQYGLGTEQLYAQMSKYIDLLAHRDPDMKILEIGAGTGGATLPVLETLGGRHGTSPRLGHYTYTDISMGFFEKAHEKFKPWLPYMTFQKFDCSQDPVDQGFNAGEQDLIIAYNVLHATSSMDETLRNVRKLLKPNGKLLLCEITNALLRIHIMVGAFDGWWAGKNDGRPWGPTMSEDTWHTVLQRNEFSGVDLALQDFEDPQNQFYSLMVSTATSVQSSVEMQEILVIEPETLSAELANFQSTILSNLKDAGMSVAVQSLDQPLPTDISHTTCIFTIDTEHEAPVWLDVSESNFNSLRQLIIGSKQSMWLTRGASICSENPSLNLMTGMARCIRAENPSVELMTVDLDAGSPLDTSLLPVMQLVDSLRNANDEPQPDWEYAIRDGQIFIQRIMVETGMNELISRMHIEPKPEQRSFQEPGRAKQLKAATPGRLDTLRFVDSPQQMEPLGLNEVEIAVQAVGLNFKDIMIAMGQLQDIPLGLDCAGKVTRVGSQVSKFAPGDVVFTWTVGTFANFARSPESMCAKVPSFLTTSVAASLPVAFSTAHYAINYVARLRSNESILIHGAAGGVGQAAIMLAKLVGARIFATVSSESKKQLLVEKYGIDSEDIFNSRDDSFADGIMRMTNKKGVDVVLNSLAGEALRRTWRCIAWFGRFIELGQKDIESNTGLEMAPFIRNVSYQSVNLLGLLQHDLPTCSAVFQDVVQMLDNGSVHAIEPITFYPISKVEDAFRLMQTGKHIGKVVVEADPEDIVPSTPAPVKPMRFQSDATYVLSGGLGGLGRSIAKWMLENGAQNLVFLSRSGARKPEAQATISMCEQQGARVMAPSCDISDHAAVAAVVNSLQDWPPIQGVIQGAMVLQDAIFENMTHAQFMAAIRPKVQGSWNLHDLLPKDLDFFIMLSSSAGIAGSRGQSNYAAGNSYQDALANHRRLHGYHGASINLGMILDVGYVAESDNKEVQENTKKWSFAGIREKEVHAMIQACIQGVSIDGKAVPTQLITGLGTGGMANLAGFKIPWWFDDSKFAHIRNVDTHQVGAENDKEETQQLQSLLSAATTPESATDVVVVTLMRKIAKSLMVNVEDIEPSLPVSRYGVDSLLAVEIRSWIFQEMKSDISVFQLLSNVPITELAALIVSKSKCVPQSLA